jgi:hypothetical protein
MTVKFGLTTIPGNRPQALPAAKDDPKGSLQRIRRVSMSIFCFRGIVMLWKPEVVVVPSTDADEVIPA